MQHLFIYGTLLFPEILEGLTEKRFETKPAKLTGHKRYRVNGCDYPAVVPDHNSTVEGKLVLDVDKRAMDILTYFEGDYFKKAGALVQIADETLAAAVFIWKEDLAYLENNDWDRNEFEQSSLKLYVERVVPETIKSFRKERPFNNNQNTQT